MMPMTHSIIGGMMRHREGVLSCGKSLKDAKDDGHGRSALVSNPAFLASLTRAHFVKHVDQEVGTQNIAEDNEPHHWVRADSFVLGHHFSRSIGGQKCRVVARIQTVQKPKEGSKNSLFHEIKGLVISICLS